MDKKSLSERDICTKFIIPTIEKAGRDKQTQFLEEVYIPLPPLSEQNIKDNQKYTEQLMPIALKEALTPPVVDEKEVLELII